MKQYLKKKSKGLTKVLLGPTPALIIKERLKELRYFFIAGRLQQILFRSKDTLAFGFEYEKRHIIRHLFPSKNIAFVPHWLSLQKQIKLIKKNYQPEALVWSKRDQHLATYHEWVNIKKIRIEDGFIRSQGLGVEQAPPHSFTVDYSGLHFDSTSSSDIEKMLNSLDTPHDSANIQRARKLISYILQHSLSKYGKNQSTVTALPKSSVLVLGQVEEDQSIKSNPDGLQTNEQLLRAALAEHDSSTVFYRPHPDVAIGARKALSKPERHIDKKQMISANVSISSLLQQARYVYTISSLGGFEALMHGVEVHTFGGPFYAGWGLTHDLLPFPRRNRNLSIEEIFYCAYQQYPLYFHYKTGKLISLEDIFESLTGEKPDFKESTA